MKARGRCKLCDYFIRNVTDTFRSAKNLTCHGHTVIGLIYVLPYWATNPTFLPSWPFEHIIVFFPLSPFTNR